MEKTKKYAPNRYPFVQNGGWECRTCFFVASFRNIVVNAQMEIAI